MHVFSLLIQENVFIRCITTIVLMKITVTQNEVALSYHKVRGLYFVAVIFAATIILSDAYSLNNAVSPLHHLQLPRSCFRRWTTSSGLKT